MSVYFNMRGFEGAFTLSDSNNGEYSFEYKKNNVAIKLAAKIEACYLKDLESNIQNQTFFDQASAEDLQAVKRDLLVSFEVTSKFCDPYYENCIKLANSEMELASKKLNLCNRLILLFPCPRKKFMQRTFTQLSKKDPDKYATLFRNKTIYALSVSLLNNINKSSSQLLQKIEDLRTRSYTQDSKQD